MDRRQPPQKIVPHPILAVFRYGGPGDEQVAMYCDRFELARPFYAFGNPALSEKNNVLERSRPNDEYSDALASAERRFRTRTMYRGRTSSN